MDMHSNPKASLSGDVIPRFDASLDEQLEAMFPVPPHLWEQHEKDVYIIRLCGMLLDDMIEQFDSHHDEHGEIVFRDDEDFWDFIDTLGWIYGYWGVIPFDIAARLYGFDADAIRDAVARSCKGVIQRARAIFRPDNYALTPPNAALH